ncbi:cellulose synthase operon protein YhjQ/BcsQ [Tunturibacter empetritectus]|uniref:Cellulose synthase operon protein YhjQ n=1 Tax=Tunturiibacter empetritectus TaxID=3069691 RepID=A0A7W8IGJ9_9BACT|nr:cellulose synthase operon protein YhjQ/BcsQ [Edaphobacter lichenicola]MBB5315981.1 cellulose synthase operon protein YhjQ [Edaphobacter lichenicola]
MDSRGTDKTTDKVEDLAVTETPEDVAVLYSWANLHGAKYRDFSASRREYRAQLRHRAAEQVREQALLAQAEAEDAAATADAAARNASKVALDPYSEDSDSHRRRALREAEEAARTAAAERLEAARRAEVAAVAEAAARREEREIAEAHASAQRQAARYADSEIRRRASEDAPELPGRTSDPYTPHAQTPTQAHPQPNHQPATEAALHQPAGSPQESPLSNDPIQPSDPVQSSDPIQPEQRVYVKQNMTPRRPQGYRPDEASGVRQIYRGPDDSQAEYTTPDPIRHLIPTQNRAAPAPLLSQDMKPTSEQPAPPPPPSSNEGAAPLLGQRRTDPQPRADAPASQSEPAPAASAANPDQRSPSVKDHSRTSADTPLDSTRDSSSNLSPATPPRPRLSGAFRSAPPISSTPARPVSPFSQALVPSDSTRGRRAQDDFDYQQPHNPSDPPRRSSADPSPEPAPLASARPAFQSDPAGPAWLYASPAQPVVPKPLAPQQQPPSQSSVADTLQHSRERVAARWYALKGVFEQPGQDQPEAAPVRQKETRTPVLAVFSLAGGVGKTSLVATVGRALSSMGEKVLLTDTTSHGLLPFYFGASELRHGTVRTFSPPSGSTDAPIYLVSYDVDQKQTDEEAQELLAEEIISNGRGAHRILLDLTVGSSWIVRRMARMSPTILVPVAPDMNSVISLQTVEKFFSGVNDGDGRPLQPFYVLNQFDTSLPLHLDVREVMRRQLGDRLLPFVIRRAQSVSEALAEGMTVVDYAPDAPVAEDYLNLATWLRTVAAPATAGFRNVRWSER